MWHVEILINQRRVLVSNLEKNFPECVRNPMPVIFARKHQYYIFDDIIFNILSMFDYLASMIGYMFQGKYLKWNNLASSASDDANEIGKSSFAQLIVKEHKRWVHALMGYRSDLIHRQPVLGNAGVDLMFEKKDGLSSLLTLYLPDKVLKLVNSISAVNSEKLDIIDGSIILAQEAYNSGERILEEIK